MYVRGSIAGLTLLAACSGAPPKPVATPPGVAARAVSEPSVPVRKRGGEKLIAKVGKAGGTLELDNGARLEIPEGALDETVEVTFAQGAHTTAFSNHDYERAVGPTLEVAPQLALRAPVKVSVLFALPPDGFSEADLTLGLEVLSDEQRAVPMQGVQTRWAYMPAQVVGGRALAELSTVPGFRLQFVVSKSE